MIKFLYRLILSTILKKKHVKISPLSLFNGKTFFEGYNVVGKNSCVGSTVIGRHTYIGENCFLANSVIGRFCSIAKNVEVVPTQHPTHGFISTSPLFYSMLKQTGKSFVGTQKFIELKTIEGRCVIVGNDVWIGNNVKIIGGIKIGNGAIVAMGSIVTKDIPPYAVVAGVPARIIRFRYSKEEIEALEEFKWWEKTDEWLCENAEYFSNDMDFFKHHIQKVNI